MLEKIASALNIDALDLFDKNCFSLIDSEKLQEKLISSLVTVVKENFSECAVKIE